MIFPNKLILCTIFVGSLTKLISNLYNVILTLNPQGSTVYNSNMRKDIV
jgi:hypothetical protein